MTDITLSKKLLLLLGGEHHDFNQFSLALEKIISQTSFVMEKSYEKNSLLNLTDNSVGTLVMYTSLDDVMESEKERTNRNTALARWIEKGGTLIALHEAISTREFNNLNRILGGQFINHPPKGEFKVFPFKNNHPLTQGISPFTVKDEFCILHYDPSAIIHMVGIFEEECFPVLWSKKLEKGKIVYFALGHDRDSWNLEPFKKVLLNALNWSLVEKRVFARACV